MSLPQWVIEVNQHAFLIMISFSFALSFFFCFSDLHKYTKLKYIAIDFVGYGVISIGSIIVVYTLVMTTLMNHYL